MENVQLSAHVAASLASVIHHELKPADAIKLIRKTKKKLFFVSMEQRIKLTDGTIHRTFDAVCVGRSGLIRFIESRQRCNPRIAERMLVTLNEHESSFFLGEP